MPGWIERLRRERVKMSLAHSALRATLYNPDAFASVMVSGTQAFSEYIIDRTPLNRLAQVLSILAEVNMGARCHSHLLVVNAPDLDHGMSAMPARFKKIPCSRLS